MKRYAREKCANPSASYTCAEDVIADGNLTESEKEYILKSMAFEVDVLINDAQENTAKGETVPNIEGIHKALNQLSETASFDQRDAGGTGGVRAGERGFSTVIAALSGEKKLDGKVVMMADRVSETRNGTVTFVSVVRPDTSVAQVGAMSPISGAVRPPPDAAKSTETLVGEQREVVQKTISEVATELGEYTLDIRHGEIADEVLRASNDSQADLIIVGSHDRSWFQKLLSPETAHRVARGSVRPVLIAPEQEISNSKNAGSGKQLSG